MSLLIPIRKNESCWRLAGVHEFHVLTECTTLVDVWLTETDRRSILLAESLASFLVKEWAEAGPAGRLQTRRRAIAARRYLDERRGLR